MLLLAEFLAVATTLFEQTGNVPEIQAALVPYGFTAAYLQEGETKLPSLIRRTWLGNPPAHQAAKDRNAALDDMDTWVAKYTNIVRAPLSGETAMLDKLGFSPRRSKTTVMNTADTTSTPPLVSRVIDSALTRNSTRKNRRGLHPACLFCCGNQLAIPAVPCCVRAVRPQNG